PTTYRSPGALVFSPWTAPFRALVVVVATVRRLFQPPGPGAADALTVSATTAALASAARTGAGWRTRGSDQRASWRGRGRKPVLEQRRQDSTGTCVTRVAVRLAAIRLRRIPVVVSGCPVFRPREGGNERTEDSPRPHRRCGAAFARRRRSARRLVCAQRRAGYLHGAQPELERDRRRHAPGSRSEERLGDRGAGGRTLVGRRQRHGLVDAV